jgi:hypothetical protein
MINFGHLSVHMLLADLIDRDPLALLVAAGYG